MFVLINEVEDGGYQKSFESICFQKKRQILANKDGNKKVK